MLEKMNCCRNSITYVRLRLALFIFLFFFISLIKGFAQEFCDRKGEKCLFAEEKQFNWLFKKEIINEKTYQGDDLSLSSAISIALENNESLKIEKISPIVAKTRIETEKAAFAPSFSASVSASSRNTETLQDTTFRKNSSNSNSASAEVVKKNASGLKTTIGYSARRDRGVQPSVHSHSLNLNLTQPLKKGGSKEVNLVSLRRAELDYQISEHEFNAYLSSFVSNVERQYWNYYLSVKQLDIVEESKKLAATQVMELRKRIKAGDKPESDLAASEAELAIREEDLIDAQSGVALQAVSLNRLLGISKLNASLTFPQIIDFPQAPELPFTIQEALERALKNRPELKEMEAQLEKNELEVVATKNGMLPRLDFFINLGKTGYSRSFGSAHPSFSSVDPYEASAGFIYERPLNRRSERASLKRAELSLEKQKLASENLKNMIIEDVAKAYIEYFKSKEQISATNASLSKQAEKLRVEEVYFNVGKTTAFQVMQAQRDLTAAKHAKLKAEVDAKLAYSKLLHSIGILLESANIQLQN
ncbi:MAG: TolC family protein [Candidatus Riflebacteria bacterium]|nr:TolC family protein [Candidatus Riflebacteria bacterium]